MAGLSIVVLLTVVVPQFTPLFESAGAELPLLTRVVIGARRRRAALLVADPAGALGLLAWLVRRQLREPAEPRPDRPPGCCACRCSAGCWSKVDTARLARTLGTLLANGVPLLNALAIARRRSATPCCARRSSETATAVKEGRGLAEPLGARRPVPAARDPPALGRRALGPSRGDAAQDRRDLRPRDAQHDRAPDDAPGAGADDRARR